jgi:two-component system C4-dicarboxylate transport response regulator DctD
LTGRSPAISAVRASVQAIAGTDADVLIYGETGTGKELAARAIHEASERAGGPFVHLNCAALPESMIENELFGHVAGAFSGAMKDRFGKFEHANRGILCLDEIDSLPMALQAKLLQALQSKSITRLGSNDPTELDFRTIAIAKTDLKDAVANGRFRADLLYRLNVVSLRLPSLDERREDIPFLTETLMADAHARYKRTLFDLSPALLQGLSARNWSGNVRELRNAVERMYLGLEDIGDTETPTGPISLADRVADVEKSLIIGALNAQDGSIKAVCDALIIPRKTLYDKMRKYGIERG